MKILQSKNTRMDVLLDTDRWAYIANHLDKTDPKILADSEKVRWYPLSEMPVYLQNQFKKQEEEVNK